MTTKADLEEGLTLAHERLTLASQRVIAAERKAQQLESDNKIQEKHITCLTANRDHVRHAIEAFVAAECPSLDLDAREIPAVPAAIMSAMGVRPAAAPARAPHVSGRDIMADILEHLHKLVR